MMSKDKLNRRRSKKYRSWLSVWKKSSDINKIWFRKREKGNTMWLCQFHMSFRRKGLKRSLLDSRSLSRCSRIRRMLKSNTRNLSSEQTEFRKPPSSPSTSASPKKTSSAASKWNASQWRSPSKQRSPSRFTSETKANPNGSLLRFLSAWDTLPSELPKSLGKYWCPSIKEWLMILSIRENRESKRMLNWVTLYPNCLPEWQNTRKSVSKCWKKASPTPTLAPNPLTSSARSNLPEPNLFPTSNASKSNSRWV